MTHWIRNALVVLLYSHAIALPAWGTDSESSDDEAKNRNPLVVSASFNARVGDGSVFLGNGASYVHGKDFWLPLNGIDWFHERIYSSLTSSSATWQGENWWGNEMMNITVAGSDGASDVSVEMDPHYTLNFTYSGGSWTCDDNLTYTLTYSSGSKEYLLKEPNGFTYVFHNKSPGMGGKARHLKRIEDAYGNDWSLNYQLHMELGNILISVVVDVVEGDDHEITYTYFESGDNQGKLQYIKVYKSTTTSSWNLIGQIRHVYHGSGSDDYGTTGDLMKVIVKRKATADGSGVLSIAETYYYRYYKGTYHFTRNPGTDHQLRFVLLPENAQRLNDDVGAPESQSNDDFDDYANVIYEYNSAGRVRKTKERLPGASCGCGGAGGTPATTSYTWSVNGGSPDLDTWNIHCVANREDDTRTIVDVNRRYKLLTWVDQDEDDGTPTREIIWHYDYGTSGASEHRLTAIHYPSACSAYSESAPYGVTLRNSDGLIYEMDYDYETDTYDGNLERLRVKKGTSGTAQTLTAYGRTNATRPDLATTVIEYEEENEGSARTTTIAYTFYDDGGAEVQVKKIEVTYPSVSASKNGPGASALPKSFFDKRTGALRWTQDGEDYVTFYAYDDKTGVQDLLVEDVNTSATMAVIDANWDGVTHGGLANDDSKPFYRYGGSTPLEIDSSRTIDWLGRTRKETDAEGMITYYVYKDGEVRIYPAWDTTTKRTLLPIVITKTDREGRPEDVLELENTVTPTLFGNEPTGAETYGNSDIASRTVNSYNISGMLEQTDGYHAFPGSGDGTRYTHYYRTAYEYDDMGRQEYMIEDVADESTYDREQVTRYHYDFVGRQIKVQEAVSDNSHDITTGKPTLTTTLEYFYDDPDSDSIPEQGDGDGNLRWLREWHSTGGSGYNNTEYRYDWRNRRYLTIPASLPYKLVKYDHLDRKTAVGSYSSTTNLDEGDDPVTTAATTRLDLSRTYYDEMGRVYKTEVYDDPGDATPEDELVTNTYYDRRGLVWAVDAPNTGVSFAKYDGASRRIQTMQGTQFDTNKYTDNKPDYLDDDEYVVEVTDYAVDETGLVTKIVTKELNHDDTDGMDLTTNDDYVRTYVYNWYDDAHRLTDTANYGTNNSSGWKDNSTAPTYGSSAPSRSDMVLVMTYTYDSEGRREKITDPKGIATLSAYDKLGRVTQKEEDDGGTDERITKYEFNAQGSLAKITADLATDQVTEHVYGDSQNARWVTKIKYPATDTDNGKTLGQPSGETYDTVTFTYNVDGTVKNRTDQNGTKLTWSYDALRRKTEEEVTTLGTYSGGAGSVDGAVRAITWKYDNEGRVDYVTSHTDTTPDTTSWTDAANQIKHTYNAADQLTKVEQEEDGAVDGSTLAVEYSHGTDYTSTGNYNRRDYIEYPDGRKIWLGYTHSGGASTFQDTINDKFSRVGQIARDNSGSKGDLLAEYDFNGMGRQVRRVHDEATGAYGNDTKMDLWHGTGGEYKGLDRFGRIVNLKHTDFSGTATDFLRREYTHDRNANRTSIEHALYKADSRELTYDNLNRLTDAERGLLDSSDQALLSDVAEKLNMDLLGNFTSGAGGIKVNGTTSSITHEVNETNEITTLDRPNPSGGAAVISDPFSSLSSTMWTQDKGTWSISSGKVQVSTLTSGDAILLAALELDIINYEAEITFPSSSSTNKAGIIFGHDGDDDYYAVVIERIDNVNNPAYIKLYQITNGSWDEDPLATGSGTITIDDDTAYILRVFVTQSKVEALVVGESGGKLNYEPGDFEPGLCGLYSDKTYVKFDDFKAYQGTSRAPLTPRSGGVAKGSLSSGTLLVDESRGGLAVIEGFADDYFVVEADASSYFFAHIWVRYQDPNNGYLVQFKGGIDLAVFRVQDGVYTWLGGYSTPGGGTIRVRVYDDSGTDKIAVYKDGDLKVTVSDSAIPYGGVAFGGTDTPQYDNVKIGYDNNGDGDIADAGDDIVWDENFASTSKNVSHDHAGNLIDDATFRYVYDAWNRLVKVQASEDSGAATIQTAEFDGKGNRIKKVVTNSGGLDGTVEYLYDGQKIIETRDGSGNLYQQFIHGTRYIDELVMVRVKDKGDLYVHQDANWNVIGLTDLGGSLVERHVYRPYGEVIVHQETGYGDYDGDGDVDSTDRAAGESGGACRGSNPSGACRKLDLDSDGDVDDYDLTLFDSLPQGPAIHPGRIATNVHQPFAHQGLLLDVEISSYQNRARQHQPEQRRFLQRDPMLLTGLVPGPAVGTTRRDAVPFIRTISPSSESGVHRPPWEFARAPHDTIGLIAHPDRGSLWGPSVAEAYVYADSSPLTMTDPSGLMSEWGWSKVHFWWGCGMAKVGFGFGTTWRVARWWERYEPVIWPGFDENWPGQRWDELVGMAGWLLCA